ncbi:MAG: molybdopterin molybdotransferase MoeA [Rhodobacteraceae bacterium]|nr:molybdopterin molybdotransferase MoeA [Paracoccaceae bacterium]
MISVEEALARILALTAPLGSEKVSLRQAAGRVLADAAVSRLNQPPFDASAMDGYALCKADHLPGQSLVLVGEAGAGHGFVGRIHPGQTVRIFTGAPLPAGADRVVLQEDVTRNGDRIALGDKLEQSSHVRPLGQDFKFGDRLAAPRRLKAADLALLAAMNLPEVTVARRPQVAILSTGDELVMPGENPRPDQIIASNGFALAAMAEEAGAEARLLPLVRDDEDSLRFAFALAEGADVIVTIGGASVGDHDLVGKVARDLGLEQTFWKIAMRPGKPLMAGRLGTSVMLGLPGNPVSAIVCAHLFLLPLLAHLQGLEGRHITRTARLAAQVDANGPRAHYMRARLADHDSAPSIAPMDRQDSALLTILTEANALLIRPPHDSARPAGGLVDYIPL